MVIQGRDLRIPLIHLLKFGLQSFGTVLFCMNNEDTFWPLGKFAHPVNKSVLISMSGQPFHIFYGSPYLKVLTV